ncbi:SRPBCC family protein [Fulvivirga lutea]|uniref:SRPBCC family protein n=1 Tax=Fulvivirga lutea TaxID=2810512 RepID=A0A974WGM5_9BACT|nr:SRPBCC family protein [Fulvivirga lutea]QSE97313.1 SRPBCC family protein [Fulvivirga lutea]
MKVLKFIGLGLLAIVVLAVIYAAFQPKEGQTERSIVIERSPEAIYPVITTMKSFNEWSPWFTIDPETKYTYEGPESGVGAKMAWESDHPEVGAGSQWIIEADENKSVTLQLDFGFAGEYYSDMFLKPVENGTEVTWTYRYKDLDLMGAFFASAMDAEGMVGDQYVTGLKQLKEYVESQPMPKPEVEEEMMESDSTAMEEEMAEGE